ncbi:MAG TPA: LPS assembly protein LptD [Desulfatiglandales bacterium]|nr:LPS assembly protein LptD [Desulfatiglandales bacterium]
MKHSERNILRTSFLTFFISIIIIVTLETAGYPDVETEAIPWQISADRIINLTGDNSYLAEGSVVISRGDQVLTADKVTYNKVSGLAEAEGNVTLASAGDILKCDKGSFSLKEKTGHVLNGTLFLKTNHYYIHGKEISKTGPETYIVKDCRITSCDGDIPDWSITGSEVKVTLEGYGTVKHAVFFVRNAPVMYFPYIIFPAKKKRQTGLLPPSVGYSSRDGMDFELPFFWAISEHADATFYERYIYERGLKQGLEFRYITGVDSKGIFQFDIISDDREQKDMLSREDVEISPYPRDNATRYWLRGRSDQTFPFEIISRFDVDFVSDYDYLREFKEPSLGLESRSDLPEEFGRPIEEIQSPTRRSAWRISRSFQDYSLQALSSFYQRPEDPQEDTTAQPAAGLEFTALPKRMFNNRLYFTLDSDYGYIYRDSGQKGQRFSLSPAIGWPVWPLPALQVEPSIKYFIASQWLDEYQENEGEQTKETYELGLRVSTILERIFDIQEKHIKRIKHKFQPALSYTFRPYPDDQDYSPWFEPIDTLDRSNLISLSLDNYLDARSEDEKGNPSYYQIAKFSLTQGYNLDEVRKELAAWEKRRPFEPLSGSLSVTPYPMLDLSANANWNHYEHYISSWGFSLDLAIERGGAKQDIFSMDFVYDRENAKNLNYDLSINLSHGFSVGASGKRDLIVDYNIENSYWIDYQSQCWGMRLLYEDLDEDRRTMLTFRLLGLGETAKF